MCLISSVFTSLLIVPKGVQNLEVNAAGLFWLDQLEGSVLLSYKVYQKVYPENVITQSGCPILCLACQLFPRYMQEHHGSCRDSLVLRS